MPVIPFPLRRWCAAVAAAGGLLAAAGAAAGTTCVPTGQVGVERCVAGLPPDVLREMHQTQAASNWCWAAAVSMVLRRYGVSMPQKDVVQTRLGDTANQKVPLEAITELLNRAWRDDTGRFVETTASPMPSWWRLQGVAAPDVLDDLHHDKPLVLSVQEHAMVLVQVVYERSSTKAVRLLRAVVLDPAVDGGLRSLRPSERQIDYLARVQVRPAAEHVAHAH
jgi:hypothetical protein